LTPSGNETKYGSEGFQRATGKPFGRVRRRETYDESENQPLSSINQEDYTMGEKKGFFSRLREGLAKTRDAMMGRVDTLVKETRKIDDDFYEELEDILLLSDCGMKATMAIMDELRARVEKNKVKDADTAKQMLKDIMIEQMDIPRPPLRWPMVMLVVGVNGAGKTTTIGKLALRFQNIGRRIILCAADTFRAAAADQLTVWANRAHVPIVKHAEGADPAAVVYDGIQSAKAQNADLLIVDTAGRLHNKKNLMDELNKMRRVIDREFPEAEVRCMLVLDATTGQNGLAQARAFKEVCEIGGIILTKLDGTAKGGIALAIRQELAVPVWYIGVGEGIEDLQPFNAKDFVEALF
jgi:fused signal recognition particle receptor